MRKARYNEVPKDYRRNYRKEIVDFITKFALCFAAILLMAWVLFTF